MTEQFPNLSPEEQQFKTRLDSLAQGIEMDATFTAQLEARLLQQEMTQSAQPFTPQRRRWLPLLMSAAALLLVLLGIGAVATLLMRQDSGENLAAVENAQELQSSNRTQLNAPDNNAAGNLMATAPAMGTAMPPAAPLAVKPEAEALAANDAFYAEEAEADDMEAPAPPPAEVAQGENLAFPTATALATTISAQPTAQLSATPAPEMAPEQMPPDMFFQHYGVNPFMDTEDDPLSTFAMDVDTASYTLARNYLEQVGSLPPPDAIRPEEFINYFGMDYPSPQEEAFAIHLDAAPAPFGFADHLLLRVGIQGRYIAPEERDPTLLIFVIDVSGSMDRGDRLELVKQALALLVDELREDDRVGIVVYSDNSRPILQPTPASDRAEIMGAIEALRPEGSTNVAAGLQLGYRMAEDYRREGQATRVIVLSDGVGNVGTTDAEGILQTVQDSVDSGITLSTIGFGMGNYNDVMMEQLANDGNGNYYYIDSLREAERVFVHNLTSTLQVIGYDAKVQVDFNPEVTDRYRLIGYENRDVADADFRNDAVDAGEVGAGHSITALYELALEDADASGTVATVYIRYQDADTGEVVELSQEISTADLLASVDDAPPSFRLAAAVAEFSELLRGSFWAQEGSYPALLEFAAPLEEAYANDESVADFLALIRAAGRYVDR